MRHQKLLNDGRGAIFYLDERPDGRHTWRWEMDPGVDGGDFMISIGCEQAVTRFEEELGLPLAWPRLANGGS